MRTLMNIFWGWMVALRALALAAIPLSLAAGIYLVIVYYGWSSVFTSKYQSSHGEMTWILSAVSIVAFAGLTFGMHELGEQHRNRRPARA